MDDKQTIREFVRRHLSAQDVRDDEDMFASNYVNSMFAMQLVQFVETTFGITCDSDDLEIANFRSIDALAAFVERKRAAAV